MASFPKCRKKRLPKKTYRFNAMSGADFERKLCKLLKVLGFWALQISRSASGAQPFDVIAVKDGKMLAVDCKVCAANTFPLSRIEDNQWLAFRDISTKGGSNVKCGIMVFYNGDVYFYDYKAICLFNTQKSIKFDRSHIVYPKERIKELLEEVWI